MLQNCAGLSVARPFAQAVLTICLVLEGLRILVWAFPQRLRFNSWQLGPYRNYRKDRDRVFCRAMLGLPHVMHRGMMLRYK